MALDLSAQQQAPAISYPNIQLLPHANGILIVVQHSPIHAETFTIPPANSDAISSAWLANRPQSVWRDALAMRGARQKALATEQAAIRDLARRQ